MTSLLTQLAFASGGGEVNGVGSVDCGYTSEVGILDRKVVEFSCIVGRKRQGVFAWTIGIDIG